MLIIFSQWIFFWVTLYFSGRKIVSLYINDFDQKKSWYFFLSVWMGLGVLTLYLQLISLILPLGEKKVLIGWLIITTISFIKEKEIYKLLLSNIKNSKNIFIKFLIFSIIIVLGLNFSIRKVVHYDAYLYHFNAVAWNKLYGIIPGLANLHFRLGFNSGIHVLAAFFEQGLPAGYSVFITNGFLLTTLFLQISSLILNVKTLVKQKMFYLMLLPFLWLSFINGDASSLSSDIAMMVMVFAWAITLVQYPKYRFLILIEAATAVVFKLSSLMILFASGWVFFKEKKVDQLFSHKSFIPLLIILGFIIRNIFISGYLFFPATLLKMPFEWTMPMSTTVNISEEIRAWAISPGEDYLQVLDQNIFEWFPKWFIRNGYKIELKIFFISLLVLLIIFIFNENFKFQTNETAIILGCIMSIIFLFVKAPDFRFGSGFFYLLGSLVLSVAINLLSLNERYKLGIGIIITFLLIHLNGEKNNFMINNWQYNFFTLDRNIDKKKLKTVKNINGYLFLKPITGDQCGNQDLLCAPFVDKIEFIDKGNIQRGFKLIK